MKLNIMSLLFGLLGIVFGICAIFNLSEMDTEILLLWSIASLLFSLHLQNSKQISELNKTLGVK